MRASIWNRARLTVRRLSRARLSYANVMSTIAVFCVLAGKEPIAALG